jgi:hypothetical protein
MTSLEYKVVRQQFLKKTVTLVQFVYTHTKSHKQMLAAPDEKRS